MKRRVILLMSVLMLIVFVVGCGTAHRSYRVHHASYSLKPWHYYNNTYHHFSFWRHPHRGGGGYYYKPRHRYRTTPYRSRTKGWYSTNSYSR